MPEKTAGPFPLDEQFDRRDVTEGVPGHPMRLGLRVVDASCAPVPGASVEIWHCDATGDYSAFQDGGGGKDDGAGTTFLRGTQTAGDDGIVDFQTIVPGWYRGRAVHIHLRVHRDGRTVLTSQLFFDAGFLEEVYADRAVRRVRDARHLERGRQHRRQRRRRGHHRAHLARNHVGGHRHGGAPQPRRRCLTAYGRGTPSASGPLARIGRSSTMREHGGAQDRGGAHHVVEIGAEALDELAL